MHMKILSNNQHFKENISWQLGGLKYELRISWVCISWNNNGIIKEQKVTLTGNKVMNIPRNACEKNFVGISYVIPTSDFWINCMKRTGDAVHEFTSSITDYPHSIHFRKENTWVTQRISNINGVKYYILGIRSEPYRTYMYKNDLDIELTSNT